MNWRRYFERWPFSVVPDRSEDLVWAGRPEVREKVESVLRSFDYRPQSTLDLIWAAFGSGKTHLLYFIEQRAAEIDDVIPWYSIVPRNAGSFSDIYETIMETFPFQELPASVLQRARETHPRFEILDVLEALTLGAPKQRSLAEDWLAGRRVDMRSAPSLVNVPYKLESASQMQRVFAQLVRCLTAVDKRVLMLLDEYQRVLSHRASSKEMLSTMILDTYNEATQGFSVVFSCSGVQQASAEQALTGELVDRMRGREVLRLPAFSRDEAFQFIEDLTGNYRPEDYAGDQYAPYTEASLRAVIKCVEKDGNSRLIPRHLLQLLDATLVHATEKELDEVEADDIETVAQNVF